MQVTLETRVAQGLTRVTPDATATPSAVEDVLHATIYTKGLDVVLDLRDLPSVDVPMATVIAKAGRRLSRRHGSLRLVRSPGAPTEGLRRLGLTDRFPTYAGLADAGWPDLVTR